MRLRNIAVLCVSTALTTGVGSVFAQGIITGSLTGTVQDPSAAVIPGAEITATNNATGVVSTLRSNQAGDFNFSALPVGTYTVIISSSGFSPLTLKNVGVSSGQVNGLGAEKLSTGSASETVEVSEAANLLETAQSQVSTTFDTQQVADLPVAGGFDELALLIPGVVSTRGNSFTNTNGAGFSSNGQRGRSNNFEIDGQSNNDNSVTGPQVFFANQDAIQEVQVISNNFSAQYGRDAGTVVNYITKSGTNTFHGSAFEFYAGSWLNSLTQGQKSPFQGFCPPGVVAGTNGCIAVKRPRYTDNTYGGTFGGPILKDKLFGFGSALFARNFAGASPSLSGTGVSGYFPTPAAISQLAATYPNSPGIQSLVLYNPYTVKAGNPTPIGTPQTIAVTDGITPSTIQVSQYSRFLPTYSTDEEVLGRLDYQATPKDRLYARYFYQLNPTIAGSGTISTGAFVNVNDRTHSVGADWTHTFSSRITNQIRYSFQQSVLTFDGGGYSSCTVSNLSACPSSFAMSTGTRTPTASGLAINIGGFGLATNLPQGRIVKDTQVQDNANLLFGKHTITFGGAFEYQNSPNVFLPTISGGYTFGSTGAGTTLPALNGLVQGITPLSLAAGNANIHFTEPDWAVYVQDDWKVTPSFTANIGLRWEYFTSSINLLHNISVANQTGPNPLWNTSLPLSTTTFPSVAEDYKHFEPRLGFAYNPSGLKALVIRGGYSVNIAPAFYNIFLNSYGSAPVVLAATVTNCSNTAKSCVPTGGSNYTSVHAQDTQYLPIGANPGQFNQTLVPSNFRQPYTQTYSLGTQYEVGRFFVAEVRYVGAHTTGDFQSANANPQFAAAAAAFPAFFSGLTPCSTATSTLATKGDVGHLHCGQTNVRLRENTAFEIYNGLQTQVTTRAYHGLTVNASYTFSRTIDNASEVFGSGTGAGSTIAFSQNPFNINEQERAVSGNSFPNVTSVGLSYVDPHFKQSHSFAGRALGGFQFNTIYLFNSGQPWTPTQAVGDSGGSFCDSTFNSAFIGLDSCRPVLNNPAAPIGSVGYNAGNGVYRDRGTGAIIAPNSEHWLVNNQAQAIALGTPYPGVSRNTLRGDSYNNVDLSIFKNNQITERLNLQLQFQVYNALNRGYYNIQDDSIDDAGSTFANFMGNSGSVRSVGGSPTNRSATLGARIIF